MENHQPKQEQVYFYDNDQHVDHKDFKSMLPAGYRFVPDDVEIIDDYLKVIVEHPESGGVHGIIFTVNLYASGPEELTAAHKEQCEGQWYFFTKRVRKYDHGIRPDRGTGSGFWKQVDVAKHIFRSGENNKLVIIGRRITLDYFIKRHRADQEGIHTDWKMIEYLLDGEYLPSNYNRTQFREWCLCRVYKSKSGKATKNNNAQVNPQVEAEPAQELDGHVADELHNPQVEAEPSSGRMLIAAQKDNEHFAGALDTNFAERSTEASLTDQHFIMQQQNSGQNAGGPGLNFVQQSTNLQSNNVGFLSPNDSNYMTPATSGSMNGMQYTTDHLLIDHQNNYPLTGAMHENGIGVKPLRSLPPSGIPMWSSDYNLNQSSFSIPNHVTSDWDVDFPADMNITFDDFQFENQDD